MKSGSRLPQSKVLRTRLLPSPRLPAQIIPLLIHAQQAQRLGLGQTVEVDDLPMALAADVVAGSAPT